MFWCVECCLILLYSTKEAVVRPWMMLEKICFMVFERYIPELKKYDSILFLYQPITSGQPLKIVQRHMAHPVYMPSTFYRKTEPTICCLILTQPEVQCFHVYCSPDPPTKTTNLLRENLYCTASCLRSNFMLSDFDVAVGACFRK